MSLPNLFKPPPLLQAKVGLINPESDVSLPIRTYIIVDAHRTSTCIPVLQQYLGCYSATTAQLETGSFTSG